MCDDGGGLRFSGIRGQLGEGDRTMKRGRGGGGGGKGSDALSQGCDLQPGVLEAWPSR